MERLMFAVVLLIILLIIVGVASGTGIFLNGWIRELSIYIFKRLIVVFALVIGLIVWIVKDIEHAKQSNMEYLQEQEKEEQEQENWTNWKGDNVDRVFDEQLDNKCFAPETFAYNLPDFIDFAEDNVNLDEDQLQVKEICFSDLKVSLTLPVEIKDEFDPNKWSNTITYSFNQYVNENERAEFVLYEQQYQSSFDKISIDIKDLEKYMFEPDETSEYLKRFEIIQWNNQYNTETRETISL